MNANGNAIFWQRVISICNPTFAILTNYNYKQGIENKFNAPINEYMNDVILDKDGNTRGIGHIANAINTVQNNAGIGSDLSYLLRIENAADNRYISKITKYKVNTAITYLPSSYSITDLGSNNNITYYISYMGLNGYTYNEFNNKFYINKHVYQLRTLATSK